MEQISLLFVFKAQELKSTPPTFYDVIHQEGNKNCTIFCNCLLNEALIAIFGLIGRTLSGLRNHFITFICSVVSHPVSTDLQQH